VDNAKRRSQVTILSQALKKSLGHRATDQAAAIAFYMFLSIFPLLLAAIGAAGYFLDSAQAQQYVYDFVDDAFPRSAELIKRNVEAVVGARGKLGLVGLIGLLWSASAAFGSITRAVNLALGATSARSYVWSKIRFLLMTAVVSILLIASVALTTAVEVLLTDDGPWLQKLGLETAGLSRIKGWATSFVFVFLMFALVFKVAPNVSTSWRGVLPGALLAAVISEAGKAAYLVYVDRFANLEASFGSLSSIVVLLLWLYLSALALVFGAEYNAVLADNGNLEQGGRHAAG
jgi:membrane protein